MAKVALGIRVMLLNCIDRNLQWHHVVFPYDSMVFLSGVTSG